MPAYSEHSSDHAPSAPNTDPTSRQSSTAGSSSTPYPPHSGRNPKLRDSLDTEPADEGEKEIWRSVRQELRQMLDDAREHLESMIKANPDRQAALRKEHEEETVVNCRKMAHEHYLEELASEREERRWLSGQKPSPSLVKQQHGIMNRIQSSTGGGTSSSSSASTLSATSGTIHNGDTRTKPSSSPPADASESRPRNDSRSSMSRPLPSFTQQPYHIPPLPPQLEAARRTSHGSGGTNNRDEILGDAAGLDAPWVRHGAFEGELRRPTSTSTSSLRSKASINEFSATAGPSGTSPTKTSLFERPSSDRHHATSPPGIKPADEFWTPMLVAEEETAAVATKQHYPIDRRSSDASLRSLSSVASGRHPPSETIPEVDRAKDREYHERKTKDHFSASNFGSAGRSPSSVSPAPGGPSSYPKSRTFDDSSARERELPDSPHISGQYASRSHQGSMDEWPQYAPPAPRKPSRMNDPYDQYPYPSQTPYQEPATRPTVLRSGSYSRSYQNYDMLDDPLPRTYTSHSQSIPVPHRSPNSAAMASSVDQPESFTGQSPGWRDWKSHQSPIPEDYTGPSYKSPSRNSFEPRYGYKVMEEPSEQPDHPGWRRRNEPWFRPEPSAREVEIKRSEDDLKKKESELISEKAELRIKEERLKEREVVVLEREQKLSRRFTGLDEREKMAKEDVERLLKAAKSQEEGARRKSEETQKLNDEAQSLREEARRSMEEAERSMEEVKTKESEVAEREEVVKNLEISTKELHARVEQTEKSLETREKELKEKDSALRKKEEDMKRRDDEYKRKVTEAKKKDLALNHRSDDISNRERAISNRENEVKRKEEDLENREQDIRNRERDAEMSKYDLDDRASSVAEREKDVEMRENSLLQARKEIEADREKLNKKWNELQKREHELSNKMKQKLEDETLKEDEIERDRERREEEEKAHDREKREELEREEQRVKDQARMQREREIQEEQKAREERQRASEELRKKEEVMKGRARRQEEEKRRQEEKERRQEEKERRQEEKEKRQWGIGDEERAKEEEWKRQQELREAREREDKERDERFKQEQERMRQQMEQPREARKRRDSSDPDGFWSSSSASGSNRVPPTRANSTTIPESRGTTGPSGWGTSAGSSGWSSSSGTSTGSPGWTSSSGTSAGSSGWNSSTGASAWSSAKASSASSTASSKTQRKPSTNFGGHSSASTSGTEKPKSIEEQNQATREKFRLEQERQETLRQAKLASAGRSTGDMMQAYIYHENQWETLPKHDTLYWDSFPWPMFTLPRDVEQITAGAIWAYLKQDLYITKDKSVGIKDRIRDQIKKWHPDRFETKLLPKVVEDQKEMVREGAGNVARCLNDLLEKAPSLMGW